MKKLILLLSLTLLLSCTNDNDCVSQLSAANVQYQKALQYSGSSSAAIQKITNEYQAKVNKINSECN